MVRQIDRAKPPGQIRLAAAGWQALAGGIIPDILVVLKSAGLAFPSLMPMDHRKRDHRPSGIDQRMAGSPPAALRSAAPAAPMRVGCQGDGSLQNASLTALSTSDAALKSRLSGWARRKFTTTSTTCDEFKPFRRHSDLLFDVHDTLNIRPANEAKDARIVLFAHLGLSCLVLCGTGPIDLIAFPERRSTGISRMDAGEADGSGD